MDNRVTTTTQSAFAKKPAPRKVGQMNALKKLSFPVKGFGGLNNSGKVGK